MAIDAKFERIQGLPTYMPEDILGYETIVEETDGSRKLVFKPGKLMAHIVLIDEDNRLSGKTKAAVLEGMEESSATLSSDYGNLAEGKMLPLFPLSCDFNDIEGPRFFMVICTENIFGEEEGTFANPVAQLDRTTLSINMLDPEDEEDELNISARNVVGRKVEKLTDLYEVLDIAQYIFDNVGMSDYAQQYKVRLIRNTRPHRVMGRAARTVKEYIRVGISPRVHFHLEAGGPDLRVLQRRHDDHAGPHQGGRRPRARPPHRAARGHGVLGRQGRPAPADPAGHGGSAVEVEEVYARFRDIKHGIRGPQDLQQHPLRRAQERVQGDRLRHRRGSTSGGPASP